MYIVEDALVSRYTTESRPRNSEMKLLSRYHSVAD